MKKAAKWIQENKLATLAILAVATWILYMGSRQGGWWNSTPAPNTKTGPKCHWWSWIGIGPQANIDACAGW